MTLMSNDAREQQMREIAIDKHKAKQREAKESQREGTVYPMTQLVSRLIGESREILKAKVRAPGGRASTGVLALKQALATRGMSYDIVLAIGARTVMDGISGEPRAQNVARAIGERIQDDIRSRELKRREPLLMKQIERTAKERATEDYRHKSRTLKAGIARANSDEEWQRWSIPEAGALGVLILDAFFQTGIIETFPVVTGKRHRKVVHIGLTPEVAEAVAKLDEQSLKFLKPWYSPMTEVPANWSTPVDGGYSEYDEKLMKKSSREDIERLRAASLGVVYDSVNAIQRTPWAIERGVLESALFCKAASLQLHGLPIVGELVAPVRPDFPEKGELDEDQLVLLSWWKAARRKYHDEQAQRKSKNSQSNQILIVAKEMESDPAIYFPHQIDYRGRVYPMALQLNPQGNDLAKGLLTFAEGRKLGMWGAYWLAVHGANCYGEELDDGSKVDKLSFNERVEWVEANEQMIVECADDPRAQTQWRKAGGGKTPWTFLAFCFEWARYIDSREEEEFVSYLPVSVDGSCSGIQHYSAMLRDTRGAVATNLSSNPEPQDIYTEVARATEIASRAKGCESEFDREMYGIWKEYGFSRALVKRPVMTTPYGVTKIGMKDAILKDIIRPAENSTALFGAKPWLAAQWIAERIDEALGTTVSAAKEAMAFLQECAVICSRYKQPVAWTTGAGLPVVQKLMKCSTVEVRTRLLGGIKLSFADKDTDIDGKHQKLAIAPNFIHGADGAHLQRTVVAMENKLCRPVAWAMVHDSFGTHAGDLDLLRHVLREEFVAMYAGADPLAEILAYVKTVVPEGTELPVVPVSGTFDLNEVLKAEFFFS